MAPSIGLGPQVSLARRGGANQAPPGSPIATKAPSISSPDLRVGSTSTLTRGTWTNSPTGYSQQWRRDGAAISGATGTTYVFTSDDVGRNITCTETATNAAGSNYANSNSLGPIQAATVAPANTQAPAVSGAATEGQTLTTTNGTWTGSPTPTFAYQWRRGSTNISGATGQTYQLVAADVGANVSCVVTATNSAGSASAASNAVGPIAAAATAPAKMAAPVLTAGDRTISVDRANTTADGGSAITRYDLRYATASSMAGATTVEMASDPQTVSGLTNATAYFVQTRAVNAVGAGEWSDAASATPVAAAQAFAFSDDFTGPDTALGERPMWTRAGGIAGGCATRSGKLSHFVSGGSDTAYYVETGYTKHRIAAEIQQATNSTTLLIAGRMLDNTNYVALRRNSNQWQLYRVINAGFTLLGSSAQAVAVGDIIEIAFDGDTVSVRRNGAEMIGTNLVMNAPTLATATKAGTVARTTFDPALDNVNITGAA